MLNYLLKSLIFRSKSIEIPPILNSLDATSIIAVNRQIQIASPKFNSQLDFLPKDTATANNFCSLILTFINRNVCDNRLRDKAFTSLIPMKIYHQTVEIQVPVILLSSIESIKNTKKQVDKVTIQHPWQTAIIKALNRVP
jgi:hypothetical protein